MLATLSARFYPGAALWIFTGPHGRWWISGANRSHRMGFQDAGSSRGRRFTLARLQSLLRSRDQLLKLIS
jgi:hypothetical protein